MCRFLGLLALLLLTLGALSGCSPARRVEFVAGQCHVDGHVASGADVERLQATLSERILARQPWFAVVTLLVVVLAGVSHIEKLVLLLSTRGTATRGLGERIRLALDRYRAYPVRYFAIVAGTLGLLAMAAGIYVYLDADKRASERALAQLQFCHLALRDQEEQLVLAAQQRDLAAIQNTAGSIHALIDRMPPDQQAKAKEIVAQIDAGLAKQSRIVADYMARNDSAERDARERTALISRDLTALSTSVDSLRELPGQLHALDGAVQKIDGHVADVGTHVNEMTSRVSQEEARLASLEAEIKSLSVEVARDNAHSRSNPSVLPSPVAAPEGRR